MPILVNILPATGSKKKNGLLKGVRRFGGALGRGVAQKVLNKLLDKADDQGKNGNVLVHLIKKWAVDTFLIPEISKFTENPYEKYTIDEYAKKYSKKNI